MKKNLKRVPIIENKDCSEIISMLSNNDKFKVITDIPYGIVSRVDTVGIALKNEGKNFVGFENNKKYFDIAKKRLNNENTTS